MNTNDTTHETMTTDEALENLRSGALLAEALNGVRHGVRLLKAFEHGEAVLAALAAAFQAEKDAKARTAAVISEAEQAGAHRRREGGSRAHRRRCEGRSRSGQS